jgi:hypothetical protein
MPPPGDDVPTWDVLPISNRDGEINPYRPAAKDRLDPITLAGRPETGLEIAHLTRAAFVALCVGAPLASLGPRNAAWYMVTAAVMVAIVLVRFILIVCRPSAGRPEVTVNSEGLTVTDVHGVTRRTTWSDARNVYIGWYSQRQPPTRTAAGTWLHLAESFEQPGRPRADTDCLVPTPLNTLLRGSDPTAALRT